MGRGQLSCESRISCYSCSQTCDVSESNSKASRKKNHEWLVMGSKEEGCKNNYERQHCKTNHEWLVMGSEEEGCKNDNER